MIRIALALLLALAPAAAAEDLDWTPHPGAALPLAARFTEDSGATVTLGDLAGKPLVLALGYYSCTLLCGVVRDDLLSALQGAGLRPGVDYALAILSIDARDRPADAARAKRAALDRYGGNGSAWHFLLGDSSAVQRAVGFHARFDKVLGQFVHPAGAVVADPDGRISAYLFGVGFTPAALRSAVTEARAKRVDPAPSPVLLLCLHYNPSTGRYSLAIDRVVSIAAALTMLVVGGGLLRAHWRRRV